MRPHCLDDTTRLLRHYRAAVNAHPDLELPCSVEDVETITGAGRIAVVFDLEDCAPLDGDLDNLATFVRAQACARCCPRITAPTAPAAAA